MPAVIFVTTDLMFASRAAGVARQSNIALQTVGKFGPELLAADEAERPRLVILDLSTAGLDVAGVVVACRSSGAAPRVVAYAPHVHEGKLAAAQAAACDAVYTRGQFDARLAEILASA